MTKQQCETCGGWFEDPELDAHLNQHATQPDTADTANQLSLNSLKCPLCGGTEFERESGSIEGSWGGLSRHRIVLIVCRKCLFMMPFQEGRSLYGWWGSQKQRKLDPKG